MNSGSFNALIPSSSLTPFVILLERSSMCKSFSVPEIIYYNLNHGQEGCMGYIRGLGTIHIPRCISQEVYRIVTT